MQKNFDKWNEEKKIVDAKDIESDFFYHEREIWWCSTGLNVGVEINGKNDNFERPMLVVRKFNKDMLWVVPMTTRGKSSAFYYKLTHDSIDSWAIVSQVKTISTKRLLRKLGNVSETDFQIIKDKIKDLF